MAAGMQNCMLQWCPAPVPNTMLRLGRLQLDWLPSAVARNRSGIEMLVPILISGTFIASESWVKISDAQGDHAVLAERPNVPRFSRYTVIGVAAVVVGAIIYKLKK